MNKTGNLNWIPEGILRIQCQHDYHKELIYSKVYEAVTKLNPLWMLSQYYCVKLTLWMYGKWMMGYGILWPYLQRSGGSAFD